MECLCDCHKGMDECVSVRMSVLSASLSLKPGSFDFPYLAYFLLCSTVVRDVSVVAGPKESSGRVPEESKETEFCSIAQAETNYRYGDHVYHVHASEE